MDHLYQLLISYKCCYIRESFLQSCKPMRILCFRCILLFLAYLLLQYCKFTNIVLLFTGKVAGAYTADPSPPPTLFTPTFRIQDPLI